MSSAPGAHGLPWPSGTATGIGSMPGTDPDEVVRRVLDLLPGLPFLPELPARGASSDLAGRSAAHLAELSVDLQPSGWRLVDRPSRDGHRARDDLARDLDALEQATAGGAPPPFGEAWLAYRQQMFHGFIFWTYTLLVGKLQELQREEHVRELIRRTGQAIVDLGSLDAV